MWAQVVPAAAGRRHKVLLIWPETGVSGTATAAVTAGSRVRIALFKVLTFLKRRPAVGGRGDRASGRAARGKN